MKNQTHSGDGLPRTPCSRSYFEVLDTGRKRRIFEDETPESARIIENIDIAMHADTREQSLAHLEEAHREIERMERDRNTARVVAADSIRELDRILNTGDTYATREIVENLKDFLRGDSSENVESIHGDRERQPDTHSTHKQP